MKTIFQPFIALILLVGISLYACSPSLSPPLDAGYTYFPLETGRFIVYDVSETSYSLTAMPNTKTYQYKEVIGEVFKDISGIERYKIQGLKRDNTSQVWQSDSLFTALVASDRATKTESNQTYVKLLFPIKKGLRWNGNLLNAQGLLNYEIEETEKNIQIGGTNFTNVLIIKQKNDSSAVSRDKRYEYFAQNIGLVYKENSQVFYCYDATCLGKGKIDYGTIRIIKINSYGKN